MKQVFLLENITNTSKVHIRTQESTAARNISHSNTYSPLHSDVIRASNDIKKCDRIRGDKWVSKTVSHGT